MQPTAFLARKLAIILLSAVMMGSIAAAADKGDPAVKIKVEGKIVDGDTGELIAARVYVRSSTGQWYFPTSTGNGTAIEYQRSAAEKSVEMHTTLSADPFSLELPPGEYTIVAERGKEYLPARQTFTVDNQPATVSVELRRWIDMASLGWYSGDTHVHRPVSEMPNVILAEDLNVVLPLTYWVTQSHTSSVAGNRADATGAQPQVVEVDKTHVIYPLNTEYEIFTVREKSHTLGAVLAIGHRTPLDVGIPPVEEIANRVHAEGGLLDLEKHSWPWSMMIVPRMQVDLYELANNHVWRTDFGFPKWTLEAAGKYMNLEMSPEGFTEWGWIDFGFKNYYALLNCGFRLRPTAGTASGVHPVPTGFGRVYVHLPEGFSYEAWMKGLNEGHSFVTTGPMLQLTFNGQDPGHRFEVGRRPECNIAGHVSSAMPLDRIEIILNGQVLRTLTPDNKPIKDRGFRSELQESFRLEGSNWMAVRAFETVEGGRFRFAHSAPVYFDCEGMPLSPRRQEVQYLVDRMEEELRRNQGVLDDGELADYRQALDVYRGLLEKAK